MKLVENLDLQINMFNRIDGRKFDELREISIEKDVAKNAEGSARVTIGKTVVLAGVKLEVGQPFPDELESGILMVNAELIPLSSPTFESGPPSSSSIELSRVVDRGIRESKTIDMQKLFIEKDKVWTVLVDIIPLNDDGNLIDASFIAAMVALYNTKMPEYKDGAINRENMKKSLPLTKKPISVTMGKIGKNIIADPSLYEESILTSRITVALNDNDNLCAMQVGGGAGAWKEEEILEAISIATKKAKEIRKLIK